MKKAFVLSAGFGKRMKELTEEKPKSLLPLAGYPLLTYTLFILYLWKIEELVINLHYKGEQIRNFLKAFPHFSISFSEEIEILESAGGIRNAMGKGKPFSASDKIILLNPDVLLVPTEEDIPNKKDLDANDALLFLKENHFNKETIFSFSNDKEFKLIMQEGKKNFYYIGYSLVSLSSLLFLEKGQFYTLRNVWEVSSHKNILKGKIFKGKVWDVGEKNIYEKLFQSFQSPYDFFQTPSLQKKWNEFIKEWGI